MKDYVIEFYNRNIKLFNERKKMYFQWFIISFFGVMVLLFDIIFIDLIYIPSFIILTILNIYSYKWFLKSKKSLNEYRELITDIKGGLN